MWNWRGGIDARHGGRMWKWRGGIDARHGGRMWREMGLNGVGGTRNVDEREDKIG